MSEEKTDSQSASFFKELGYFMKPHMDKYVISTIISLLSVVASLCAYVFVGKIAGAIFTGGGVTRIIIIFLAIAVLCKLINAVFMNWSTWISHNAAYLTLKDIRLGISEKMMKLPIGYFEGNGSGRLKSMMVDHIEQMEKTLAHMIPEFTANITGPLILLVWSFFIDWRVSLCAILWIGLGLGISMGMMKDYNKKYSGQIAAAKSMNQAVVEYVNGIEVIKNFGRFDDCYGKYKDKVFGHAQYNINWLKDSRTFTALGMAIAPFSVFPVLISGLIFYSKGTLDAASLFLLVVITFGIFGPLMKSMSYFDNVAQMGTNAREIRDVLSHSEVKRGSRTDINGNDIELRNVSFSYDGSEEKALDDISVKIPAGSMLALVGPSGSGKSTVAKLIAGYWDPGSGDILIGGEAVSSFTQEVLNQRTAYVEQETFLFDMSIMENIRMGRPLATDEEVMETAKHAGCHGFISELPEGYHTTVGEAGGKLSGGERQRIAIVRAMMKNAPIIILDEATASADPENETAIQNALSAATKDKTLIVVAHRLSTIVSADQIAFVKDGMILCMGGHEELMENCTEYKLMWALSEEDAE